MPSRAPSASPHPNALVRLFVQRTAVRALAFSVVALAVAAAAVVAASARGPAAPLRGAASTLTVTNTNDSGAGSLRDAVAAAAPGDVIDFALPHGSVITLTSGELIIDKDLTINGPGQSALAISGGNASRVFFVPLIIKRVNISGLTIRDGVVSAPAGEDARGGGLLNQGSFLSLTNVTVTNNRVLGGAGIGAAGRGAGIFSLSGSLALVNVTISNNTAEGTGFGGIGLGGGLYSDSFFMTDCVVSGNMAVGGADGAAVGGGIFGAGGTTLVNTVISGNRAVGGSGGTSGGRAQGGGINTSRFLELKFCTVSGNAAISGDSTGGVAGEAFGGGIFHSETLLLTNSTVSDNTAGAGDGDGGGAAYGGGIYGDRSYRLLRVTNSTVSGNRAVGGKGRSQPGGWAQGGGFYCLSHIEETAFTNSTVVFNSATGGDGSTRGYGQGGGVLSIQSSPRLLNTIVAGNIVTGESTQTVGPDLSGPFESRGSNFIGTDAGAQWRTSSGGTDVGGNFIGTASAPADPRLGPLADNGGPTRTHRPLPGSPVIEAGDNATLAAPFALTTDQRGPGFPRRLNTRVDIGAVEAADSVATFEFAGDLFVSESTGHVVVTVVRTDGPAVGDVWVDFATTDGTASSRSDYATSFGTLHFAPFETAKAFEVFITDDAHVEGNETVTLRLTPGGGAVLGARGASTLTIMDNDATNTGSNPIDAASFFVRQHYIDFLNREPDAEGLQFWTSEIESCGADAACREAKRVNVSAAFFLSIEYQATGFFAVRVRHATLGQRPAAVASRITLEQFLRDSRELGEGVVVGRPGWEQRLRQNRQAYLSRMAASPTVMFNVPMGVSAAAYVDFLFGRADVAQPTAFERQAAMTAYGNGSAEGRAAALESVADSPSVRAVDLVPTFALAEYFGYLRRDPTDAPDSNDAGYQFWLAKLNSFGGDYVRAEMVKAFINSAEYRRRFGAQ